MNYEDRPLPEPLQNAQDALNSISERLAETQALEAPTTEDVITAFNDIGQVLRDARDGAIVYAVDEGIMTQKAIADRIHRHPITVSRLLRASRTVETTEE